MFSITRFGTGVLRAISPIFAPAGPVPLVRTTWSVYKWPVVQLLSFISAMLLGYDVSNVANIQVPIVTDFGKVELLTWVAIGYIIVNSCVVPLCRRLYMFGDARWYVYIYVCIWMAGVAVAEAATNMDFVVFGRAIIGIGGAGLYQGYFYLLQAILFTEKNIIANFNPKL